MPVTMTNRAAHPVSLEAFEAPCKIVQEGGLFIPFYNNGETAYVAGEPIVYYGRVCIVQRTILPGKMGTLLADWIVDAILAGDHSGDIDANDLVYWDTDEDQVVNIETGVEASGIGNAVAGVPTNGFILGRAVPIPHEDYPSLDGSGNAICATTGSKRVRVVAIPGAPTTYSA